MTNITMENHHRNSGFSHWKWWCSIAMYWSIIPCSMTLDKSHHDKSHHQILHFESPEAEELVSQKMAEFIPIYPSIYSIYLSIYILYTHTRKIEIYIYIIIYIHCIEIPWDPMGFHMRSSLQQLAPKTEPRHRFSQLDHASLILLSWENDGYSFKRSGKWPIYLTMI